MKKKTKKEEIVIIIPTEDRETIMIGVEKEHGIPNFFMPAFRSYEKKRVSMASYTPPKKEPKNFFDVVEGVIEGYRFEEMGR